MGVFVRRAALGCVLGLTMALAVGGVAQAAWAPTGALTGARYDHTATVLEDGKVLVAGGSNNIAPLSSVELFDPVTDTWTSGSMKVARAGQAAVRLDSGQVLVAGGWGSDSDVDLPGAGDYTRSAELYDP